MEQFHKIWYHSEDFTVQINWYYSDHAGIVGQKDIPDPQLESCHPVFISIFLFPSFPFSGHFLPLYPVEKHPLSNFFKNIVHCSNLFFSLNVCTLVFPLTSVSLLKTVRICLIEPTLQALNSPWQGYSTVYLYSSCFPKWLLKISILFQPQIFWFISLLLVDDIVLYFSRK